MAVRTAPKTPNSTWRLLWNLSRGDLDTTIAQAGFNLAQMIIPAFLLAPAGIPLAYSVHNLLPGYASGFLVGSLGMAGLAVQLARREHRRDVTAHVYGNNVPAILAYTLSIILPVYLATHDAATAWRIGAAAVIWTGIIKLMAAPFAGVVKRAIPQPAAMTVFGAAMYSYLAFVLLQRIFDQPLVGLVALAIVAAGVLAGIPITRWRIPPFLAAWIIPLAIGIATGYVRPDWQPPSLVIPVTASFAPWRALAEALPYLSVIAPIAIYQVLQDIASVAGGAAAGDGYEVRHVLALDALATLVCGAAGSVITPVVYAMLPPYKAIGARIAYSFWAPLIFLFVVMSGLTLWFAQLFPWPILAAIIGYVSVGVGMATLRRVETKYHSVVLLGFVLPAGAVIAAALNSALPAAHVSLKDPAVGAALNRSVYWSSIQGLGNGFLFLVLVVAAVVSELIDRNFGRAATWCAVAAIFSWFGLMHSAVIAWGAQPAYAEGWLAAGAILFSAHWWRGDAPQV